MKAYFNIQRYRFEDKIELVDEVDESLLDVEVPPLILQPLVENAILHGILPDGERKGVIAVRAACSKDVLTLEVADNGRGMDGERLKQVRAALASDRPEAEGTGLRNVHRRIRYRYDEPYGLRVYSEPEAGTRCELTLPKAHGGKDKRDTE
ncbi:hypothetical protein SD70_06945 [Gordoniibacillus kamchatkensis]|uniref:Histidine kinase domain-containing protein n=1 Tax=Gordoniibacillus kamchatkensis TaxID=1590651 RepID=A0ABR5AK03_9BACL|nr:ATP-binding protein [Paenibacillus sp. VKM B-2647]KIL41385.1 hypothetical protein SD70_06945 [Paenibacillus sp. VKM B-2647]